MLSSRIATVQNRLKTDLVIVVRQTLKNNGITAGKSKEVFPDKQGDNRESINLRTGQ